MARKTLSAKLVAKATQLRGIQEEQNQASINFIQASGKAQETAFVAEQHAVAVEKAISIITEAGVQL